MYLTVIELILSIFGYSSSQLVTFIPRLEQTYRNMFPEVTNIVGNSNIAGFLEAHRNTICGK